jgi:hypothetical protein
VRQFRAGRAVLSLASFALTALLAGGASALLGLCGPFTDVTDAVFCPFVLEIYTLGITSGTTATTYSPGDNVTRLQMAAFLSREADRVLQRGSRRAALGQYWVPEDARALHVTTVGATPRSLRSDGEDVWVSSASGTVARIHGSDGRLLGTWTGATQPYGVLVAAGRIFVSGGATPGILYRIDPRQPPGMVTTVATTLGSSPAVIAYDGSRIWTANNTSVSIVTPAASLPWTVTTVTAGFTAPLAALFDGSNVWITDDNVGSLSKLDSSGAVLQTITTGSGAGFPAYDGTNIWLPTVAGNSVEIVRSSTGAVLATLTGTGLNTPSRAAFDGQRVLLTNGNDTVSLWKAADFSALGSFSTGAGTFPGEACSDGSSFWITLQASSLVAKF